MALVRKWTAQDDEQLRSIIATGGLAADAAQASARTVSACHQRMAKLGIKPDKAAFIARRAASLRQPLIKRFFSKVEMHLSGCWHWTGATCRAGYGQLRVDKKPKMATHVALELHGFERVDNAHALHSCDNPKCVNPAHLRWGSHVENLREMVARGRADLSGLELGRGINRAPLKVCKWGHDRTAPGAVTRKFACRECLNLAKREKRKVAA